MIFGDNLTDANWMRWPETADVMSVFTVADASARFVGGCVRDGLLGLATEDVDICTPLDPERVVALMQAAGHKVFPTGIKHGTVTVVINHRHFEITTLRVDVKTFGRHAEVAYTEDWELDAHRRDFTVNALYADMDGKIYDPVDGLEDLQKGLIRFVGTAAKRIAEDRLRVLRFFRFFARYGKTAPDPESYDACRAAANDLSNLAPERIQKELLKLLAAKDPVPALRLMYQSGVLPALLPMARNIERLNNLVALFPDIDPVIRLGALPEGGAQAAGELAVRLRLSNRDRDRIINMAVLDLTADMDSAAARRWRYRLGKSFFHEQAVLLRADNPDRSDLAGMLARMEDWQAPEFPVSAQDFMSAGMTAGPDLGVVMRAAEAWWVDADFAPGKADILKKFAPS